MILQEIYNLAVKFKIFFLMERNVHNPGSSLQNVWKNQYAAEMVFKFLALQAHFCINNHQFVFKNVPVL